jgi:hypothetical protein
MSSEEALEKIWRIARALIILVFVEIAQGPRTHGDVERMMGISGFRLLNFDHLSSVSVYAFLTMGIQNPEALPNDCVQSSVIACGLPLPAGLLARSYWNSWNVV